MFHVISLGQARACVASRFGGARRSVEEIVLRDALGRVLAEDVRCGADIPPFARSMVDGYAVMASDTFGASETMPAMFRLTGAVRMGTPSDFALSPGTCASIPTGGMLPENADAVVMLEHTEDLQDGYIYAQKSAAPGAHVVFPGDDAREGDLLLSKGCRLDAFDIGVLAACGYERVRAASLPRVGIISTGDEIMAQGAPLAPGKMYDVNGPALAAAMRGLGQPVLYGVVPDEAELLRETLRRGADECDVMLLSGGSSVGERDHAQRAFEALGAEPVFHGLALKPGKPTLLYQLADKPLFGLPGHPAAALMVFLALVKPLLSSMMDEIPTPTPPVPAKLTLDCPSNHGREEYVLVRLEGAGDALSAVPITGKSGLITLLSRADGFFVIPRESEGYPGGKTVGVQLFTNALL